MKKIYFLLVICVLAGLTCRAQYTVLRNFSGTDGSVSDGESTLTLTNNVLYGVTLEGGHRTTGSGNIFSYNVSTGRFNNLYIFDSITWRYNPVGGLIYTGDYRYYGVTRHRSKTSPLGYGSIYRFDAYNNSVTEIFNFTSSADHGEHPKGLLLYEDYGTYYGVTSAGGANDKGIVFFYNTNVGSFVRMHSFAGSTADGDTPVGNLVLYKGCLYGATEKGGLYNNGCIFSVSTTFPYYTYVVYSFTSDNGAPNPVILSNGYLYGTTGRGSSNGCIYKINLDNYNQFTQLYAFGSVTSDGTHPWGGLTISANGSVLYGTTMRGGTHYTGTIFKINTDGTSYAKLYDMNANNGEGTGCYGSLTLVGNSLYGVAQYGGTDIEYGCLFRYTLSSSLSSSSSLKDVLVGANDVSNPESSAIRVYPNPAIDHVKVELTEASEIVIIDFTGKVLISRNGKVGVNNISLNLPQGIYVLKTINLATKMETIVKLMVK